MDSVRFEVDPPLDETELRAFWLSAWGCPAPERFRDMLARGLAYVGAYDGARLIGFVNVAWDGGIHAFLLDTAVHPAYRRRGIATALVRQAVDAARGRGAKWLHVDFEPHLADFYRRCGFRHTEAGLIAL